MKQPVLSYVDTKEELRLTFPEWTPSQIDAVREPFICWKLVPNSENVLRSELSLLALWEVRETFPRLEKDESVEMAIGKLYHTVEPPFKPFQNLFENQLLPTSQLYHRSKALLTAAPGLGKTIMALSAIRLLEPSLVMVVAPLTSLDGWVEETELWATKPMEEAGIPCSIEVWRKADKVKPLAEDALTCRFIFTAPSVLTALAKRSSAYGGGLDGFLYREHRSVLVLDESFFYQNRKAERTRIVGYLSQYFDRVWGLSGMPTSKHLDDLFAQLKLLRPKTFSSYWKFANRYCLVETNFWGSKIVGDKPGAMERLKRDLADLLIEVKYPDNIPGWEPQIVECPMTPVQEQIYLQAKEKLQVEASLLGTETPLTPKTLLSLTVRLQQIASNPLLVGGPNSSGKWDTLFERIQQDEGPFLLWVKHIKTASLLGELLQQRGLRIGTLTGATKLRNRYPIVKGFQEGAFDGLILNDAVGKYSLTLTRARVAYYLEKNFDGEAYYQSLFRARRVVSQHPIRIVHLHSVLSNGGNTLDALITRTLTERSQNAQRLTVGQLLGSC